MGEFEHVAGEPAPRRRRRFLPEREEIGPPECPIMHRWEVLRFRGRKLMVHRFLPNADDRAVHDHPSPFVTLILAGGYVDHAMCPDCHAIEGESEWCSTCEGAGVIEERMRPGMVRYRRAEHAHRTRVGPRGCWTVVVMGRKQRPWGFWTELFGHLHWLPWRDHERLFGFGMRCPGSGEEGDRG